MIQVDDVTHQQEPVTFIYLYVFMPPTLKRLRVILVWACLSVCSSVRYTLHTGFQSGSVISQFLLYHNLGIFSCKRYKHYFSQTEMYTSNIQFGYLCLRGGGQAVQAGLSCTPPRIWVAV